MLSVIKEQLKQDAQLHRESDRAELIMPDDGKFLLPSAWVDALVEEHKLAAQRDGFYRLTQV